MHSFKNVVDRSKNFPLHVTLWHELLSALFIHWLNSCKLWRSDLEKRVNFLIPVYRFGMYFTTKYSVSTAKLI